MLFNDQWLNSNHFKAAQKSDEFWFKYDKVYYLIYTDTDGIDVSLLMDDDRDLFNTVVFESQYRQQHYFTEADRVKYEKWIDKLIPDDYDFLITEADCVKYEKWINKLIPDDYDFSPTIYGESLPVKS